jgi:DNA-binding IclR family transcriptional regulator
MDVKTAGRMLDLFETFATVQTPLSLSELARALNAPPSSCFNLIRALQARGYLYSLRPRRQLYPTRRLFEVAKAIVGGEPWMARVEPVLTLLRDQTQETVILGKRQGDRVVYLNVIEGPQTIRYTAQAGDLKPLHSSAIGKALLGTLGPAEVADVLKQLPLDRVTEATITDCGTLLADLDRGRKQGHFVTAGENVGPMHRMTDALTSHVAALKAACATISDMNHERTALQRMG